MQIILLVVYWLVVSIPLKNMKVSWDDYSKIYGNTKKCSKPPTSISCHIPILFPFWSVWNPYSYAAHGETIPSRSSTVSIIVKSPPRGEKVPKLKSEKQLGVQWEYTHKIWPYMVQYLHFRILEWPLMLHVFYKWSVCLQSHVPCHQGNCDLYKFNFSGVTSFLVLSLLPQSRFQKATSFFLSIISRMVQ